jgi:DNA topoisomerase-1
LVPKRNVENAGMASLVEVVEAVEESGLIYTSDREPGISRKPVKDFFEYFHPNGKRVEDEKTLERIRHLAIPPAYQNVWICKSPRGHLQATGKDARGRKQYRYHEQFREIRDAAKFDRMIEFGEALPEIHKRLAADLARRGFPREKVLALVVSLLEKSLIRVGNEEYAKENKHYGLTTMRSRHVNVEGADLKFSFMGKSGIKHKITLKDRKLANAVRKLQELPGQELFQFLDSEGNRHSITSNDVNAYLKEISGHDFTAKDFRTWAGTVLALTHFLGRETPATKKALKSEINAVVKAVAQELGNTPAVCRKAYIHPAIFEHFSEGRLLDLVTEESDCAEAVVIDLLRSLAPKA